MAKTRVRKPKKKQRWGMLAEQRDERERINQFFADKADYDTETETVYISQKLYSTAFPLKQDAQEGLSDSE